jgi:hypothetical protein
MRTTLQSVRSPVVAGLFYPGEAAELRRSVHRYLDDAPAWPGDRRPPKAVIAPHAGYAYSGATAGFAFRALSRDGSRHGDSAAVERVVLLGPSHRIPFRGVATTEASAYATPLGEMPIDRELVSAAERLPVVAPYPAAHAPEHSLEVELPFLQELFAGASLLPLVVGDVEADDLAAVLEAVWGGSETVIVVSSDLSHYLSYEEARRVDRATAERILALDGPLLPTAACGAFPINGLLAVAAGKGLRAELLDLRSSGDTAGDKDRVVGYGAFAFA